MAEERNPEAPEPQKEDDLSEREQGPREQGAQPPGAPRDPGGPREPRSPREPREPRGAREPRGPREPPADLVPLAQAAAVLRVPLIRNEPVREGELLKVVTPRDIPSRGYLRSASEQVLVRVKDSEIEPFILRPFDVLFSIAAPMVGRITIVPEGLAGDRVPSPHFAIIRFEQDARDQALALYAFFKLGEGRKLIERLQADDRIHLLPLEAFTRIRVPKLTGPRLEWARSAFQAEMARPERAPAPEREERGRGGRERDGDRRGRGGDRRGGDRRGGERRGGNRPGGDRRDGDRRGGAGGAGGRRGGQRPRKGPPGSAG